MRVMRATVILVLLCVTVFAQGFPWEIFQPRTLKEVISITTKAVRPDDHMFLAQNQLESRVEVEFTGKSRPISKGRKSFIDIWFGMLRTKQKHLAELYDREYLYKEGEVEYWLPTQRPITKYFDKELKPGDKMDLYLISTGAYRTDTDIDCVLLVEEFQKKAAQEKKDAFAEVPATQREKFKSRLEEFVEYHRTRQWDKVYDLIAERHKIAVEGGLPRDVFLSKKLYSPITRFTPESIKKMDDESWMVLGCGTFDEGGPMESAVEAYLQDGDWYFSDIWSAPACVDCKPKSCKH